MSRVECHQPPLLQGIGRRPLAPKLLRQRRMTSEGAPLKSSPELADDRTRMAFIRTVVALDRTLMAWVRTAVSLISFGFTIYKFFQGLVDTQVTAASNRLMQPRDVALVLMGTGILGLAISTLQYRRELKALQTEFRQYGPFKSTPTVGVASAITAFGIIGFVLVVFHQ
jgi:putative membrane protein